MTSSAEKARRPRRCPSCHYDLSWAPETHPLERCPECGASLSAEDLAHARERRFFRRLAGHLITTIVVLTIASTLIFLIFPERRIIVLPVLVLIVGASAPAIMAVMSKELE